MTPERERLWSAFDELRAANALPGQLMTGGFNGLGISTSGHPLAVVSAAQAHARIIQEFEQKLDEPTFVRSLYPDDNIPKKPKLRWTYNNLDLGLLDEKANFFGNLSKGPN